MENISFDPDSLLDHKKIKLSKDPMTFSDQLANQISSKISNLFPKSEEIKKKEAKDKNCLLNFYPKNKIPRNTRCKSTGLKYKNCCGKVS